MRELLDTDFQSEVREDERPTVVMFTGSWCQPCKRLKPVMEEIRDHMKDDIQFVQMDIEKCPETAQMMNIRSVPSLVLLVDGMVRDVKIGFHQKRVVQEWIVDNI